MLKFESSMIKTVGEDTVAVEAMSFLLYIRPSWAEMAKSTMAITMVRSSSKAVAGVRTP